MKSWMRLACIFSGYAAFFGGTADALGAKGGSTAASGLLRRDSPNAVKAKWASTATRHGVVLGPGGESIVAKQTTVNADEMLLKTGQAADYPFSTDDAFEFRMAPLRYGNCPTGSSVSLSLSDQDWKTCAARVQSRLGEQMCSRRRGNMLWPRTDNYMLDSATTWHPCECCQESIFDDQASAPENSYDTIWNLVWDQDCASSFTGANACGQKQPNDTHALGDAVCAGGDCTEDNDRWTCCHKFVGNCTGMAGSVQDAPEVQEVTTNSDGEVSGGQWGATYYPSQTVESFNRVGPQACGKTGTRPAMPKGPGARNKLLMTMRGWPQSIAFVWLGISKEIAQMGQNSTGAGDTSMWKWDDGSPVAGTLPWDAGGPAIHDNQRGCVDRNGKWHGCSRHVQLRIACETRR